MKSLIFDSGPIISLTTNNLLWTLDPLLDQLNGNFYMPKSVRKELVDKPLLGKKYKFEALQVLQFIDKETLKILGNDQILRKTKHLLELANTIFKARGNWIKILHLAEVEVLACSLFMDSAPIVIDERTTRMLIEAPDKLRAHLESKLHTPVKINDANLAEFSEMTQKIKVIRSVELMTVAYELGLLERYITKKGLQKIPNLRRTLLDSVLWGCKLNGCAVSKEEIEKIIRFEDKRKALIQFIGGFHG